MLVLGDYGDPVVEQGKIAQGGEDNVTQKAASGRLRPQSRWMWSIKSAAKRSPPDHSPKTSSAMPRMGTVGWREGDGGRGWLMGCTTKAARRWTQAALCLRWEE